MIAECAADLVARISTVPSLASSTRITLGGKGADPSLVNVPLPACWVTLPHHQVDENPFGATSRGGGGGTVPETENTLATFSAVIYIPYLDDNDMVTVQYPLLEAVIKSVKANKGISPSGNRWRFVGQKLSLTAATRLVYQQLYTVRIMI